ncbi:SDR family oxidoreductase [Mycolicibacterium sp. HK-90]|uniref:SDR family oxidoreductase n=1 Tax=Mycolicibacterium sp. HK-90 TaxID=3056937 RepID=UPI0034628038
MGPRRHTRVGRRNHPCPGGHGKDHRHCQICRAGEPARRDGIRRRQSCVLAAIASWAHKITRSSSDVNGVCPGPTGTRRCDSLPEPVRDGPTRSIPLRGVAKSETVVNAAPRFGSDGASKITGQVRSVSGCLTVAG